LIIRCSAVCGTEAWAAVPLMLQLTNSNLTASMGFLIQ